MGVGHRLHLRLFLEGVEVPVIAANIQATKNAAAACSIQIPANDYALDLKPRTLVHLFVYDIYNGVPPPEQVSIHGPGIRVTDRDDGIDPELEGLFPPERFESTEEQTLEDLQNENYKLAFGGEITGLQFSKTPSSRSIVLQCMDWSSYWDIAIQYMVSGFSLGGGGIRAAFTGAGTTVFNDFFRGSADIVTDLLAAAPRSQRNLRGTLLGGLVNLLEALGGTYFGRRSIRGVNDFFSLAEMRLHLTQMIGANPYPERDEIRLLRAHGFGGLFRRSLSGLGRQVSIRAVLLALQRFIFHEIIPVTSPRYIGALHDPALPRFETVGLTADTATQPLARAARILKARAEEIKERQARSTTEAAARHESDRRGNLRTEIRYLVRTCNTAARNAHSVGINSGDERFTEFFGVPEIEEAFRTAGGSFHQILDATRRGQRVGIRDQTFYPPDSSSAAEVNQYCDSVSRSMQGVLDSQHRRRIQRSTSQPEEPQRLLAQIYRPDVWMVAPPRCNVFFPELYSSFTYSRNFQQEITRLLLRTSSAFYGSDYLFDGHYMAPSNILSARGQRILHGGGAAGPDNIDAPAWVRRALMDHELFTGIIPTFERMTDLNLHAIAGGSATIQANDGSGEVRVPYAQLAANHIFFQYRFRSRQLMLQGKFNPYAVLGFPCLVLDKYLPRDLLREGTFDLAFAARLAELVREGEGEIGPPSDERRLISEANTARVSEVQAELLAGRPNTHYLGTPGSVTHSIDVQSGGSTQIQMEYARTTNERTEFLGDNVSRAARTTHTGNVTRHTIVAALAAPGVGTSGYYGGRITEEPRDVTDQFLRRIAHPPPLPPTPPPDQIGLGPPLPPGTPIYAAVTPTSPHAMDRTLPLFVQNRAHTGRRFRGTRVRVGITQAARLYGPEVVGLVGSGGDYDAATATDHDITVTFKAWRITEEIGAYRIHDVDLPPEDICFPPWYGDHYRTEQVGGLYSYYFGTGAITDPLFVLAPGVDPAQFDGVNSTDAAIAEDAEGRARAASIALVSSLDAITDTGAVEGIGTPEMMPVPGDTSAPELPAGDLPGPPQAPPDDTTAGILGQIPERSPIAEATEEIIRAYSQVRLHDFDVQQFIRAYTWRPIASMVDMFGTANLEINDAGEVVRGREGFHSRAFGDFDDLRELVAPGEGGRPQTILGLSTRDPDETSDDTDTSRSDEIAANLDTRKEKRLQVLKYLYGLGASRGVLG